MVPPSGIQIRNQFHGSKFRQDCWDDIPPFMLLYINDQRKFGYSDSHIAKIWSIVSVPPSDYINKRLNLCYVCNGTGHQADSCPDNVCIMTSSGPSVGPSGHSTEGHFDGGRHRYGSQPCFLCGSLAHLYFACPGLLRCNTCSFLGHTHHVCHPMARRMNGR